jgi:hypothetical protein
MLPLDLPIARAPFTPLIQLPIRPRYSPPVKSWKRTIEIRQREIKRLGLLCHDCGIDTIAAGEYYMVDDRLWDLAWSGYERRPHGKRLPGDEILCLVCLRKRIGRPLVPADFTAVYPSSLARRDRWGR